MQELIKLKFYQQEKQTIKTELIAINTKIETINIQIETINIQIENINTQIENMNKIAQYVLKLYIIWVPQKWLIIIIVIV